MAGDQGRPLLHRYTMFGHPFDPVTVCSECTVEVTAREVTAERAPGAWAGVSASGRAFEAPRRWRMWSARARRVSRLCPRSGLPRCRPVGRRARRCPHRSGPVPVWAARTMFRLIWLVVPPDSRVCTAQASGQGGDQTTVLRASMWPSCRWVSIGSRRRVPLWRRRPSFPPSGKSGCPASRAASPRRASRRWSRSARGARHASGRLPS